MADNSLQPVTNLVSGKMEEFKDTDLVQIDPVPLKNLYAERSPNIRDHFPFAEVRGNQEPALDRLAKWNNSPMKPFSSGSTRYSCQLDASGDFWINASGAVQVIRKVGGANWVVDVAILGGAQQFQLRQMDSDHWRTR